MAETENSFQPRRALAAIVFTDVASFSALMEHDEERTLRLVHRDLAVITGICQKNQGRVLKSTGDGLLMYFESAVQAVACALEAQQAIADQARKMPPEEALAHRIGIHLGDVFLSATDVMGDGVNVAARLQGEAEPGGICISQTVYDVVKNRLAVQATFLGPRELKNIKEAVPVYQILLEAQGVAKPPIAPKRRRRSPVAYVVAGVVAAIMIALLVFTGVIFLKLSEEREQLSLEARTPATGSAGVAPSHGDGGSPAASGDSTTRGGQTGPEGIAVPPASMPAGPSAQEVAKAQVEARRREQEQAQLNAEIDAARRTYMPRYDFSGMLNWLDKKGLKSSPAYGRYSKMRTLKTTVQLVDLPSTSKSQPLAVTVVNPQGTQHYDVWENSEGQLVVRGPEGERKIDFQEADASLIAGIFQASLKRLALPPAKLMELNEGLNAFVEECKFCRLIPDSAR